MWLDLSGLWTACILAIKFRFAQTYTYNTKLSFSILSLHKSHKGVCTHTHTHTAVYNLSRTIAEPTVALFPLESSLLHSHTAQMIYLQLDLHVPTETLQGEVEFILAAALIFQ